jgi:hypothetical protein
MNEEYQDFIEHKKQQVFHLERLNAPEILINEAKQHSSFTLAEYYSWKKKQDHAVEKHLDELRAEFVITEDQAQRIFQRFDDWFDRYKDNLHMLEYYDKKFYESWLWGKMSPFVDKDFCEKIFDEKYHEVASEHPVFAACKSQVQKRIKELDISTES